ncbi:hypothetical protein D3C79_1030800 [compost metagenome]
MGNIKVPTDYDRLPLIQLQQIGAETVLPFHSIIQTRQIPFGIGSIDIYEIESVKFQGDRPAFGF